MKKILLVPLTVLLLTGSGCLWQPRSASTRQPAPAPSPQCPDVCAAICAGRPEPVVPAGCPMPMCACDPIPPGETY